MNEISKRIKELRKNKGMTGRELAEKVGISKSSMYRYETNCVENMPIESLKPIAKALGTTPEYLMGWDKETPEAQNITDMMVVEFEELGTISAGYNGSAIEAPTGRVVPIPIASLNKRPASDYFVLRVKGDSMYPTLIEGDDIPSQYLFGGAKPFSRTNSLILSKLCGNREHWLEYAIRSKM